MKNIFKLLFVSIFAALFFVSCDNEADRDWTTPEADFQLYDTTLGANTLYPTMESNPFILTWDNTTSGSGEYTVYVSSTEDFASKVALGTSTTNTFSTTIGALNTAMLQAGLSPYSSQTAYIRIEQGSAMSNVISFTVTTYPSDKPVLTNPTSGSFVLDSANPSSTVTTATWTDYATYGVDVTYSVDIAAHGTENWVSTGTVVNDKSLVWVTSDLNDAAATAGLVPNVAAEVDVRVTATTESTGGTITNISEIVTITLTPYIAEYVPFFLVGGGTAVGWNAGGAQELYQNANVSEVYTYLQQNGQFRFLGQQDWNPINYSLNTTGIRDNYKYFNTWPTTIAAAGDENMEFSGASGMYHISIDQNTRALTITASSVPTVPTDLYLVGSLNGWDANNALPMTMVSEGVFEYVIEVPSGAQFKFIGQQSWTGIEYGNIHGAGNTGYLGPNNDNNNIEFDGDGGFYKITADIKRGIYKIEK